MDAIETALRVIVLDPKISAWLRENDPKALAQAQNALGECPICQMPAHGPRVPSRDHVEGCPGA